MRRMGGADIVVAGAGAIGRAVALALVRAGHRVTVVDPLGANASGVAAGMLAPAFEALFDGCENRQTTGVGYSAFIVTVLRRQ